MSARYAASPPLLAQGWLLLAVGALGLGAMAALMLVAARTPWITAFLPADAFPRALVVHVNLATTIWYTAMACGLWTERISDRLHGFATGAFVLSLVGALGVVGGGLFASGAPVLANYVPYVDHPFFLASMVIFAVGGLTTALLSLRRPQDTVEWGFMIARAPFVFAALYVVHGLMEGAALSEILWGAGHVLQFGHVALLMAIWLRLVERAGGRALPQGAGIVLFAVAALPAVAAPLLALCGALASEELNRFHTELMRWANWPAPLLLGLVLLMREPAAVGRADGVAPSLGLFVVGCLAGAAIDSQTTMIPAHYHGTIGAFTLVLMAAALARGLPDTAGRAACGLARLPLALYATGIMALIGGLAWSGLLGAARKSPFSAEGVELGPMLAASVMGLGGAIAVAGVCLFVVVAYSRIVPLCLPHSSQPPPGSRRADAPTFASVR